MPKRLFLEDIEKITDNKYLSICIAAKRARQISEGARPTIDIDAVKDSTIALHELFTEKLSYTYKEIETRKEEEEKTDILALDDMEDISVAKAKAEAQLFKPEYVDDFDEDQDDEEPEEGL